jgi:phage baseplate assembly protein W
MATIGNLYKGFSTKSYNANGVSFGTYNIECVKQDLINHIYTIPGERIHMPAWGTRIPTLTFEPNDQEVADVVREDLTMVFDADPRVTLLSMDVLTFPDNNALVAVVILLFNEFNVTEEFNIEIKSRN